MKKILVVFLSLFLGLSIANANAFSKKGKAGSLKVEYASAKALTKGMNTFSISVKKGSKVISDAKVQMQIFMPEMPGMPYMEDRADAVSKAGKYEAILMVMMPGTWQVRIFITTKDGKKYRLKSSMII